MARCEKENVVNRGAVSPKVQRHQKSLAKLCAGNMLGEFQCQADTAACRFADKYGDGVFCRTVDGVNMRSPVDCFYGETLREHERKIPEIRIASSIHHAKKLSLNELSYFHKLAPRAAAFMEAVKRLPGCAPIQKRTDSLISASSTSCELMGRSWIRAVQVDHRQTYFVLMCLNRAGLPGELGRGRRQLCGVASWARSFGRSA